MNAAAKALSEGSLFEGAYRKEWVTKPVLLAFFLFIAVLISALMVIYAKELERRYVSEMESLQTQFTNAKIRQSQLLLEKSTWASSYRMQQQAMSKLNMKYPTNKRVLAVSR
jgi:cell division protein FtsL